MATPEAKVKKKVKDYLTARGIYYTMPFTAGYGANGVPDILVCYQGKFYGIECKANGNKPTALQAEHMKNIQRNGGTAVVIDENNIDTMLDGLFNDIDDGRC